MIFRAALIVVLTCLFPAMARAQFTASWNTIDGGGATALSGGNYDLAATLGQPDAGAVLTGGNYTVIGGFMAGVLRFYCFADYNHDGFVDGIDSDIFNNDFEAGDPSADINGDGFVDGIDSDEFNNHFDAGC